MLRFGLVAAAIVLTVGVTRADSITYELVANVVGFVEGSKPVGTITFAHAGHLASSYDIATMDTEFDLGIADYPSAIPRWKSGQTGISANGTLRFSTGVIGDAVLIPFQTPTNFDPATNERWVFRYDFIPLTGPPTGPADLSLRLIADTFANGWQFQDSPPVTPTNPNGFPTVNDFTLLHLLPENVVEWELRIIPEPGTVVLSGFALASILVWRRRKRVT